MTVTETTEYHRGFRDGEAHAESENRQRLEHCFWALKRDGKTEAMNLLREYGIVPESWR